MRLLCLLGFHTRSRGRAHCEADGYVSACRYCDIPMRRLGNGAWVVAKRDAVER